MFLPGYKKDKRVDLVIAAATPQRDGQQLWNTSVRYPGLSMTKASTAQARVSMDGHLLQLEGTVQSDNLSAYGVIRQETCNGTAGRSIPSGE